MTKLMILLLSCCPIFVCGQTITPMVLSNGGLQFTANDFALEFTLGEVAVATLAGDDNILTLGFHQGLEMITPTEEPKWLKGIKVFPNPATTEVIIETEEYLEIAWQLIDLSGRSVLKGQGHSIIVDGLQAGTYFLRINSKGNAMLIVL